MRNRLLIAAIVAGTLMCLVPAKPSVAQQSPSSDARTLALKNVITYGPGAQSCGAYTAERMKRRDTMPGISQSLVYESWLAGFVSGVGVSMATRNQPRMLRPTDLVAMSAWVGNYCAANPLKRVVDAALSLVDELFLQP